MNIGEDLIEKTSQWIQNANRDNDDAHTLLTDLLMFCHYGQDVLSQFDMGLCGFAVRHNRTDVLMTVKAREGTVPLVAYITSSTTTGCVSKFLDLLEQGKLKWTKDKYPWG